MLLDYWSNMAFQAALSGEVCSILKCQQPALVQGRDAGAGIVTLAATGLVEQKSRAHNRCHFEDITEQ